MILKSLKAPIGVATRTVVEAAVQNRNLPSVTSFPPFPAMLVPLILPQTRVLVGDPVAPE
jgi:hypothetical protein